MINKNCETRGARRVREAAWGNGPVDNTGTAPQIDFTNPETARVKD